MKTKELFLLRGLPGAGKSTLAKSLGGVHFEADMFFETDGKYNFNPSKIKDAHEWCRDNVELKMSIPSDRIVVSNTFTQGWEMEPYFKLAEEYGYKVYSLIVENRHEGENIHGVPYETLNKMRKRFEVKL